MGNLSKSRVRAGASRRGYSAKTVSQPAGETELTGHRHGGAFQAAMKVRRFMKELTISVPDELSAALEADAQNKGKNVDEVATEAVKRCLAHEKLEEL